MKKGFTLIELLVVISIIGVLATIVISSLTDARDKVKITLFASGFRQLDSAFLMHSLDYSNSFENNQTYIAGNAVDDVSTWSKGTDWVSFESEFSPYFDIERFLDSIPYGDIHFQPADFGYFIHMYVPGREYNISYMEKLGFGHNIDYGNYQGVGDINDFIRDEYMKSSTYK